MPDTKRLSDITEQARDHRRKLGFIPESFCLSDTANAASEPPSGAISTVSAGHMQRLKTSESILKSSIQALAETLPTFVS